MRGVAQVVVVLLTGVWLAGCGTTSTTTTTAGDLSNPAPPAEQAQDTGKDSKDSIDATTLAYAVPQPAAAMPSPQCSRPANERGAKGATTGVSDADVAGAGGGTSGYL
jgi:hypothetical protein